MEKNIKSYLTATIILGLLLSTMHTGFSQSRRLIEPEKRMSFAHTLQLSYNYLFAPTTTFTHRFSGMYNNMPIIPREDISEYSEITKGWSALLNGYFGLIEIAEKDKIVVTYGIDALTYGVQLNDVRVTNEFTYKPAYEQFNIGVPIGIAYKHGGEASITKTDKVSTTIGASLAPTYITYKYTNAPTEISGTKIKVIPQVYAELGFFAGIEWKIRGSVYPGTQQLFEYNNAGSAKEYPTNTFISGKSGPIWSVGIGLMPFSYKWSEGTGW